MFQFKSISIIFILLILAACSSANITPLIDQSKMAEVDFNKTFYVAVGVNAKDRIALTSLNEEQEVENSAKKISYVIYKYLKSNNFTVNLGTNIESEKEALNTAKAKQVDYLIYPRNNYWSDVSYLLCTNPYHDEVNVDMIIYDINNNKVVNMYNLASEGCPFIVSINNLRFFVLSASSPEARFKKAFKKWWQNSVKFS